MDATPDCDAGFKKFRHILCCLKDIMDTSCEGHCG